MSQSSDFIETQTKRGQSETFRKKKRQLGEKLRREEARSGKRSLQKEKKKRRKIPDESLEKLLPFAESTQNRRAEFRAHLHRAAY